MGEMRKPMEMSLTDFQATPVFDENYVLGEWYRLKHNPPKVVRLDPHKPFWWVIKLKLTQDEPPCI